MAEEWTEFVWIGIALIAFATVLTIAFNFMQLGKDFTNVLYQEQADAARVKEVQAFLPYDDVDLSGSEAFAAAIRMANSGYPTLIVCAPTTSSVATKAIFMYDSQIDATTARTNLNNVYNVSDLPSFTKYRDLVINGSSSVFNVSNIDYTTPALLDEFDMISKYVSGDTENVFSAWSFHANVLEDNASRPLGLVIYRTNASGGLVV